MNFDFSDAAKAKESGKRLEPGIKNATFQGIEYESVVSQKNGNTYNTLCLKLNIEEFGDYVQKFFEPESNERGTNMWGGVNPSPLDHFKITLMEILMAVAPEVVEKINNGELKMQGNFKSIVKFMIDNTNDKIGTEVQVKMIPGSNGYVSMPSFPARIDKVGNLAIANRIIGQNLTLSSSEVKKIQAAETAKPSNMEKKEVIDILEDAKSDLASDSTDDLPF